MTRTGKIARLPRTIRDQLNRRLDDGELAAPLIEWLNSLPDTQLMLKDHFNGRPINENNISEWKHGGFLDWLRHQEACDWARLVGDEADHISEEAGLMPFSDRISPVVTLVLARQIREFPQDSTADSAKRKELVGFLQEFSRLRRDDHNAALMRLQMLESWKTRQRQEQFEKQMSEQYAARLQQMQAALSRTH